MRCRRSSCGKDTARSRFYTQSSSHQAARHINIYSSFFPFCGHSEAHGRLDKFEARGTTLEFLQMLTKDAAPTIPNSSVDFVYVDARHDFCGAIKDIELYWPKLREGGIMAGHDYVREETWKKSGQDWALCEDGSRNPLAVLGAVNQFAAKHELQVGTKPGIGHIQ